MSAITEPIQDSLTFDYYANIPLADTSGRDGDAAWMISESIRDVHRQKFAEVGRDFDSIYLGRERRLRGADNNLSGAIPDLVRYSNVISNLYFTGNLNASQVVGQGNVQMRMGTLDPFIVQLAGRQESGNYKVGWDLAPEFTRIKFQPATVMVPFIHSSYKLTQFEEAQSILGQSRIANHQAVVSEVLMKGREITIFQGGAGIPGLMDTTSQCTEITKTGSWAHTTNDKLDYLIADIKKMKAALDALKIPNVPLNLFVTIGIYELLEDTELLYEVSKTNMEVVRAKLRGGDIIKAPYIAPTGTERAAMIPSMGPASPIHIFEAGVLGAEDRELWENKYAWATRAAAWNQWQETIQIADDVSLA